MAYGQASISIVFPCYNDALTIGGLIKTASEIASSLTDDFEIIVIDDGSRDESFALLRSLQDQYKNLFVYHHEKNQGYGAALRHGFSKATKFLIFYTDGDGQYDVSDLKLLWKARLLHKECLVTGYKANRSDSKLRILTGLLYRALTRALFRYKTRDVNCDFRLFNRSLLKKLDLQSTSGTLGLELVVKMERAGVPVLQVSVPHYPRRFGKSEFFSFSHLWSTALALLKICKSFDE